MHRHSLALVGGLFVVGAAAQSKPEFEVASIRPSGPVVMGQPFLTGGPGSDTPTRVNANHALLLTLITRAYDIPPYRLKGATLPDGFFDVAATIPEGTTPEQYQMMWQNLLADRFHLKVHWQTEEADRYELTVDPKGHKLTENTVHAPPSNTPFDQWKRDANGKTEMPRDRNMQRISPLGALMQVYDKTMAEFATQLANPLKAPVVDQTGLTGRYDFQVEFESSMLPGPGAPPIDPATLPPPLPVAIRTLGLRLEKKKGPVDYLIVDSIDKMPTEN